MKKFILILLLLLMSVNISYAQTVAVDASGRKAWVTKGGTKLRVVRTAASKSLNTATVAVKGAASVVVTSSAGKAVTKTVPYLANKPLLVAAVSAAVLIGADYLFDYLSEEMRSSMFPEENGDLYKTAGACDFATGWDPPYVNNASYDGGHFTSKNDAYNASLKPPVAVKWHQEESPIEVEFCGVTIVYRVYHCPYQDNYCGGSPPDGLYDLNYASYSRSLVRPRGGDKIPVVQSDVYPDIEDMADNNPDKFVEAAAEAVDDIVTSMEDPHSPYRNNPGINYEDLIKQFIDALDQTILQNMINSVNDPVTYPDTDVVDVGTEAAEQLTETQVKRALKEALSESIEKMNKEAAGENLSPLNSLPLDEEPDEYGSIKPLLDGFMASLASLPVISFFTDIKDIDASGTCTFDLVVVNPILDQTTNIELSLCPYESTFNFMGSVFLLLTGIIWTRYLFEG